MQRDFDTSSEVRRYRMKQAFGSRDRLSTIQMTGKKSRDGLSINQSAVFCHVIRDYVTRFTFWQLEVWTRVKVNGTERGHKTRERGWEDVTSDNSRAHAYI